MARWAFDDFVIDLDTHELLRSGNPVPLSPKAFQLLGILVANRPRALSKGELQDHLWPGTFVVEKNVTNLVGEVRAALGDPPVRSRFIRTVPRFGYAFVESSSTDAGGMEPSAASIPVAEWRRHNLPEPLTSFVGREREIAELTALLPSTRLLTLTGAGGCGKTRLAIELARRLIDRFQNGVWMVDLAPLSDPGAVVHAVAPVFDVRQQAHHSLGEGVANALRNQQILLILDNCEHVIAPCAELAQTVLHAAPGVTILATSREGLVVPGETIWRVPSLSTPDSHADANDALAQYEAVRLLIDRARTVDPTFTASDANAAAVIEVCERLDGIPLAIELAAARLSVLSIEQIRARLHDRFRLLTGGSRTALARQRTLEATVDWSYDLLLEPERLLLRRLAVFARDCTIETAEAVCAGDGIDRANVLELVSRLADKSLVIVEAAPGGERRYRLLETVRHYARERLRDSGEAEHVCDRHLAAYVDLGRHAEQGLASRNQVAWLNRLQLEHDNLRAALDWSLSAPGRARQGLELATAVILFWVIRGYFGEGQRWLERVLAASDDDRSPVLHARALLGVGEMAFFQGDFARTRELLDECASRGRAIGDPVTTALALGFHALAELESGDPAEGVRLAEEGRAAGRTTSTPWIQGPALSFLAYHALHEGDCDRAAALYEEGLELLREGGLQFGIAMGLIDLAVLRVIQQRHQDARALCAEAIGLFRDLGDRWGIAWCLGILAGAEAAAGRPLSAARLCGAMEGLLESVGAPVQATYYRWIGDQYLAVVQQALGRGAYQEAVAEGRAMSLHDAVADALEQQA